MAIVLGAGYFIYQKAFVNESVSYPVFLADTTRYLGAFWWILPLLVLFSVMNWMLEISKWQTLASVVQKVSYKEALIQSLSSHTLSLLAPFKTGEYVGKALYFKKDIRKKIILLNFVGNMYQLLVTLVFGTVGLVYFVQHFHISWHPYKFRFFAFITAFFILVFLAGNTRIPYGKKGNYYQRALAFTRRIPKKIKYKTGLLSVLRYLVFSHQFYLMLGFFGVEIAYTTAMLLVFVMYFIATLLPVMSLFDFLIKGSVAIYLFGYLGVDQRLMLSISILMWLLNFVLPAVLGSYFVLVFKPDNYITKSTKKAII